MKRFFSWLRRQFTRRRFVFLAVFTLLYIAAGIAVVKGWEYSNSSEFCSEACHDVHPEEIPAYQDSYHARVKCVECHMGRLDFFRSVALKAGHAGHLPAILLDDYERPLWSASMRPANESCELCHWPESFHNDTVREIKHYATDETSAETSTYLVMHVGGGTAREGRGKGIHWHIENKVEYIPADARKQQIPWVRVTFQDGRTVEYMDADHPLTSEEIAAAEKRTMDCVDCHNRIGHPFPYPEQAIDEALALGQLDRRLPEIKARAMDLLTAEYASPKEALAAVEAVREEYVQLYPEAAAAYPESIDQAEQALKELLSRITFEEPDLNWRSFPDNNQHKEFPGCFRCHDGRHFNETGESIRMQCVLCHTLPVAVGEGQDLKPAMSALAQFDLQLDSHEALISRYDGPATCRACHPGKEGEVMASVHYTFDEKMGRYGVMPFSTAKVSWLSVLDEEQGIGGGCGMCHLGGGDKPKAADEITVEDKEKLDCLICHAAEYDMDVRLPVKDGDRWVLPQDRSLKAAQSVGRPTVKACDRCHRFAAGESKFKQGLDFEVCGDTLQERDLHFEAGMTCLDCHPAEEHHFAGSAPTLAAEDWTGVKVSCVNSGCHTDTPHQDPLYNRTHDRLDCRTCHITSTGGLLSRDVTAPLTFNEETGLYVAAAERAAPGTVQPVYRWYDGVSKGPLPTGSRDDEASKIMPFKFYRGTAPADQESGELLSIKVDVLAWTGDLEAAIRAGVAESGQSYSGSWLPQAVEAYFLLNHGVAKEGALTCANCHGEESLFDFAALGYSEEEVANMTIGPEEKEGR